VAGQTRTSTIEELRRAVQDKERELSELDLILADYHTEHSRLILELRRLLAKLRDEEEISSSLQTSEFRG
jgi:uncharacterized coiled-coil protein SlyX